MKKKIIVVFLAVMFFMFLGDVKALNMYNNFKKGDKIEVKLNKDISLNFYAIEDSTSEDSDIIAIYEDVLGDMFWFDPIKDSIEGSVAETKLKELTKDWITPGEISLLKANEIKSDINISQKEEFEFNEPVYYHIGKSYWTETVSLDGKKYYPYVISNWGNYSVLHTTQNEAPSSGGHIRPVILIDKAYIKNGIINKPKNIEEFISDFENHIKENHSFDNKDFKSLNISYLDHQIIIEYGIYKLNYTYNEGRLDASLDADSSQFSYKMLDWLFEYISLLNSDVNFEIIDSDGNYKLETQNKYLTCIIEDSGYIKNFSIDLNYYLWPNNTQINNSNINGVSNPKTNDINILFVSVGVLLVGFGIILGTRKLKKLSK